MTPFSDISKENSFGVPDGYFDSLTDQIQTKIKEEELKKEYGNQNPFTVPEGYFRNLTVQPNSRSDSKIITMLKPWLSVAAGILFIFAVWQLVLTQLNNDGSSLALNDSTEQYEQMQYAEIFDFSDIDDDELDEAVTDYIQGYDEKTINTVISEESDEDSEISEETEAVYEYYIDYSDEYADYEELLAEL